MREATLLKFPWYVVRDDGTIWSVRRQRLLRPSTDRRGYRRVVLVRADQRSVCCYVHRVVAVAFVPEVDGSPEVEHLDGNPRNCAASNLQWVTHLQNIRLAIRRRGCWQARPRPDSGVPIVRVCPETLAEQPYESIRAAIDQLNRETVARGGVAAPYRRLSGNICHARDRRKISYGYYWLSPRRRLPRAALLADLRMAACRASPGIGRR